jgi:hypothetical protein
MGSLGRYLGGVIREKILLFTARQSSLIVTETQNMQYICAFQEEGTQWSSLEDRVSYLSSNYTG